MIRREQGELRIFDTPDRLAQGVADAFVEQAAEAIRERGAFFVGLAGGTTPKAAYQLWRKSPAAARSIGITSLSTSVTSAACRRIMRIPTIVWPRMRSWTRWGFRPKTCIA